MRDTLGDGDFLAVILHEWDDVSPTYNTTYQDTVKVWEFSASPSHTVAVEKTVKLVTDKCMLVCGLESRVVHSRSTLKS